MTTAIFVITTIICGIGWLVYWVSTAALVKLLLDKGYDFSESSELGKEFRECVAFVIKMKFRIK